MPKLARIFLILIGSVIIIGGIKEVVLYFVPVKIVITSKEVRVISWLKRISAYSIEVISDSKTICGIHVPSITWDPREIIKFAVSNSFQQICGSKLQGVKKATVRVWVEADLRTYTISKEVYFREGGD